MNESAASCGVEIEQDEKQQQPTRARWPVNTKAAAQTAEPGAGIRDGEILTRTSGPRASPGARRRAPAGGRPRRRADRGPGRVVSWCGYLLTYLLMLTQHPTPITLHGLDGSACVCVCLCASEMSHAHHQPQPVTRHVIVSLVAEKPIRPRLPASFGSA